LEDSIVAELTHLLEGDFFDEDNKKLKKKYERGGKGWKRNIDIKENLFKAAIIQGIDKCHNKPDHPIRELWCSNGKKEHGKVKKINRVNNEYVPDFSRIRLAKKSDLAWRTIEGEIPNWFCQIKVLNIGVNESNPSTIDKKTIQALGDLFWGLVDREYLIQLHRHFAEFIFIWIEDKNSEGTQLNFDSDEGSMKFILSPGYHKDLNGNSGEHYGELRFEGQKGGPWINKSTAEVKPHNRTAIKEILAAGTNGTFFRQFNQSGRLIFRTTYRQFDTGKWRIFIHRITPSFTLRDADVPTSKFGGGKLFNWIP